MIEIKLTRIIKGKDLVKEFEEVYESIGKLENIFKKGKGDMKLQMDLENWKYYLKHPDEEIEQDKIIFTDKTKISMIDLELLNFIKSKKPKSITELAKYLEKDVANIQRKVDTLEQEGFIELEKGNRNSKIPVLNYDKIEIAI